MLPHPKLRALLADDWAAVDPALPPLLEMLFARSAGEDWHKAGTFKDHLFGVARILTLWNQPREVVLLGLFHSVYSNEYVDLKLFDGSGNRAELAAALGEEAERLVHTFCTMPRSAFTRRLAEIDRIPAEGLVLPTRAGDTASPTRPEGASAPTRPEGASAPPRPEGASAPTRPEGASSPTRPEGAMHIPARDCALFGVATLADIAEQWHSWQDEVYQGFPVLGQRPVAQHWAAAIWPGPLRPSASILSLLARLARPLGALDPAWGVPAPPVFDAGRGALSPEDEAAASALYWQAVNRGLPLTTPAPTQAALRAAIAHNPWVGEPRLMLAQIALGLGDWAEAEREAAAGLTLLAQWGTPWDKRIAWSGWVSWARILLQSAQRKSWPETLEGLNALGLVAEG
jgi:hypothetical protein